MSPAAAAAAVNTISRTWKERRTGHTEPLEVI